MALMNMVSSNINQWDLLAAMLPIVYSISMGAATPSRSTLNRRWSLADAGTSRCRPAFPAQYGTGLVGGGASRVLFAIPFFTRLPEPVITWIYFGWAAMR
jgi:hypothetical protein